MTTMMAPAMPMTTLTKKQADYMMAWRELWLDHIYWTRLTVLGIAHDMPGLEQTEARLLRNVDDMCGMMAPEYGMQALEPFRQLLRDHLLIAAKLVTEAKQGAASAEQTEKDWYQNADEICRFLSSANPNIPYEAVRDMFYDHLAKTKGEAVYRLQGQWDMDIQNWENIESMGVMMADAFSTGIIKQFPDKFA